MGQCINHTLFFLCWQRSCRLKIAKHQCHKPHLLSAPTQIMARVSLAAGGSGHLSGQQDLEQKEQKPVSPRVSAVPILCSPKGAILQLCNWWRDPTDTIFHTENQRQVCGYIQVFGKSSIWQNLRIIIISMSNSWVYLNYTLQNPS